MVRHLSGFDQQAAAYARLADRQFSEMRGALRKLQDNVTGLRSRLKVPTIRQGSRYSPATRDQPSALLRAGETGIASVLTSGLLSGGGFSDASFYTSASQSASSLIDSLRRGQRLR